MGIISGLISMFGWGTSDFLAAKSSRKIGFVLTFFWAQIFGISVALVYLFLKIKKLSITGISQFTIELLFASLFLTIAVLFYYRGLEKGKISLVSPIGSSFSLVTVILSVIFFHEILKPFQIIAIILIILGIILVSINFKEILMIKKITVFSGVKEGVIAMFLWGITYFLIISPIKILGWFIPMLLIKLFSLVFIIFYLIFKRQPIKINVQPIFFILLFLTGFLDILASFALTIGIESQYASIIVPVAASYPLVTIIMVRLFLKEKLVLNQVLGIIITILGLILISIK